MKLFGSFGSHQGEPLSKAPPVGLHQENLPSQPLSVAVVQNDFLPLNEAMGAENRTSEYFVTEFIGWLYFIVYC